MANPTLGANFNGSIIAVPSLTASDFVISTSEAGFGILEMKTILLLLAGALHFDVNNEGDYVLHTASIEHADGKEYNNGKESLATINFTFEPNNDTGTTGETARAAIDTMRRGVYDLYIYDNQRRTSATVHKMVGVLVDISKPIVTPADKVVYNATGMVKKEADYTYNVLRTTYPAV